VSYDPDDALRGLLLGIPIAVVLYVLIWALV
jgi:hypothetical protein